MQLADRVIVPGEYWRRVFLDALGLDPAKVRAISNAVGGPPEVATRAAERDCRLVFLGSLTHGKGLADLLRALAHESVAALRWRSSIAGEGDVRPFAEMATRFGLGARVAFTGWLPSSEVSALLDRSDVFVLPSHNEGLSIALLEAMAHGCAVVTTPVGDNAEAVTDGVSGLLVPKGDPERLAAALTRVIGDVDLRAALQAGARRRWSESFEIADHCRKLIALYQEISEVG